MLVTCVVENWSREDGEGLTRALGSLQIDESLSADVSRYRLESTYEVQSI
ncbi:unnamed protein product [Amoebophrya sp. A25]|nr:unnamed protein product [Amoebophrya sp. A25]|eukprot:GSA25T00028006001.1